MKKSMFIIFLMAIMLIPVTIPAAWGNTVESVDILLFNTDSEIDVVDDYLSRQELENNDLFRSPVWPDINSQKKIPKKTNNIPLKNP